MEKIKISAVMYLNTLPMVYGLNNCDIASLTEISLDTPAGCAQKLVRGEVDAGLIPVAIIPQIKNPQLFSKFCIGAIGKVRSVVLFSKCPFEEISHIILDVHSKTSVALFKILAKEYWKKDFIYKVGKPGFEKSEIQENTGGVVIGDKVFEVENKYPFVIDLAEEWHKFTGLPFVFATWVSDKVLPDEFVKKFETAMEYGINNIRKAVKSVNNKSKLEENVLIEYLQSNIDYRFDNAKKEALELFLKKIKKYNI